VNYIKTEKLENSANVKVIPFYNYKKIGMPDIEVSDENGTILIVPYDANLSTNIKTSRFPINLVINNTEIIELKEPLNYIINLYVNCFKTYNVLVQKEKTYAIKTLTYYTEN
jgi:hypothetical protein